MDQNEENRNNIQQQLFFKYLIESIQKQQQLLPPIEFKDETIKNPMQNEHKKEEEEENGEQSQKLFVVVSGMYIK